ncbi:hypothetical protein RJ639_047035 [Escallonia herrerae]|uniref:NAC domain-containing protein n=1 Tax=Escallonia herrerae TaxID=1293975 RepID=A0AA88W9X2_9ASTE|nr:hypothetical protein RJ639_047035 [Escallonia herrerae]
MNTCSTVGLRFMPTQEELISYYLRGKVIGKVELPPEHLVETDDLYGDNSTPWEVLPYYYPWDTCATIDKSGKKLITKHTLYVFTRLKKVGKSRILRKAGNGTWDGQSKGEEVKNSEGEVIGLKKMLVFELKTEESSLELQSKGHWIMHEYALAGVSLEGLGDRAWCHGEGVGGSDHGVVHVDHPGGGSISGAGGHEDMTNTASEFVICKIVKDDSKCLRHKEQQSEGHNL